jgi:hypothetical protein
MSTQETKTDSFVLSDLWSGLWKTWWQNLAPAPRPLVSWPTPAQATFGAWQEYWTDAWQRSVLYWDVMRKRGNLALEHQEKGKPPVLSFPYEMVVDGRTLDRPVNYFLLRIVPGEETPADPRKRPFVVVDPRAGHGPGIGGFKADSEIGVAMKAGHPCYFVGFRPEPEPDQTLEDVGRAEAAFLQKVAELHPDAEGRPCVIGNCQAGWAVMMLSAVAPELMGPVLIAGAPLSYWAGSGTQNPMRYSGGLFGGSWLALLASDLGNGRFDGANLVANFESLNPANTYWTKQYNVYAKVDTEEPRYLEFERWWGGFFLLNEEEMRFIVENLFVGNKLAAGEIVTSAGRRIDLRNIRSPIVVFASWGDDITPPQQALNWILDCYSSDREILSYEQTIVYLLHQDIGHLGIFVSGKVAKREHAEIVEALDVIETLPPGLYEMVIEDKRPETPSAELIPGRYVVRFERRTLDDIRALEDTREDEKPFGAVARVSEINESLYRTVVRPWVQAWSTEATAETLRQLHPNRLQSSLVSDQNPWMAPLEQLAEWVRANRQQVSPDNPFLAMEKAMSKQITDGLKRYGETRDQVSEQLFNAIYTSPWLQAVLGLRTASAETPAPRARDAAHEALVAQKVAALRARIGEGGLREGLVRIILYAGAAEGSVDTRGFRMSERLREEYFADELPALSPAQRRELIKEQFFMLLLDEAGALAALPKLLVTDEQRRGALEAAQRVLSAVGELTPARKTRLRRVAAILGDKGVGLKVVSQEAKP